MKKTWEKAMILQKHFVSLWQQERIPSHIALTTTGARGRDWEMLYYTKLPLIIFT